MATMAFFNRLLEPLWSDGPCVRYDGEANLVRNLLTESSKSRKLFDFKLLIADIKPCELIDCSGFRNGCVGDVTAHLGLDGREEAVQLA